MEKIITLWNQFSKIQKMISVLLALLATSVVVGGVVLIANSGKNTNAPSVELETENNERKESEIEEVFQTEATEETESEVIETISVVLSASSIEKDLKIKILDENDVRIKGQPFVITVTPEGANEGIEYNDHDMDGIIIVKPLEPGKYTVQLHEMEGYVVEENPITATVKDQIVYEKVDISNEIKDESEIDSSKEESKNNADSTENEIKDTLAYVETSVKTDEVTKDKVDLSVFADAKVSEEKNVVSFGENEVALPKSVTLYTSGNDTAKTVLLQLDLKDEPGIVKDIAWELDDAYILDYKVAEDKKSATITMKSAGKAMVSVLVSYETTVSDEGKDNSEKSDDLDTLDVSGEITGNESIAVEELQDVTIETVTVACSVSVENQPDNQTQLKDTNGSLLYLDKDATKIATPSDYLASEKFYVNPKYTGWQKLDGKVYYYKADNTYATGKQIIGGVEYEFDETGYLITRERSIGIDVSKWQGEIDWEKVANSGVGIDFAIIRCGYRGISSGDLIEDPYFKKNIEGAIKNGIKVGVYFYSQAITKAEAIEEASMALELVKGYNLQLPIYIDTEGSGGRGDTISKSERTEILKTFCEVIKNAGFKPGVYSGRYWYNNHVITSKIEQYHIWVAQYNDVCEYEGRYDIWQYTSSGSVPGINGKVDMNIAYRVYH